MESGRGCGYFRGNLGAFTVLRRGKMWCFCSFSCRYPDELFNLESRINEDRHPISSIRYTQILTHGDLTYSTLTN